MKSRTVFAVIIVSACLFQTVTNMEERVSPTVHFHRRLHGAWIHFALFLAGVFWLGLSGVEERGL